MTRASLLRATLLTLAVLCIVPAGQAQDAVASELFANLSVIAFGDQEVDLATGITTLPDGGQVIDREHDVTMTAARVRYREGEFVEAESVEVTGAFGTARADRVDVNLVAANLEASGNLVFERPGVGFEAQSLRFLAEEGIIRFEGPIIGLGIEFEAGALVLDTRTGDLLLAAPYRYVDGPLELSSQREGALLSLRPVAGETLSFTASSRVAPELLERLGPFLP